jgi:hypothetical protein
MQTLFIFSTNVQWAQIMYQAGRANGIDYIPSTKEIVSPLASLFFVFVLFICNFFIMNLFIGVILTKYNRQKELVGNDFLLTEKQKQWVHNKIVVMHAKPKVKMQRPRSDWRLPFYYTAKSGYFKGAIMFFVFSNAVILSLEWYGQTKEFSKALDKINFGLTISLFSRANDQFRGLWCQIYQRQLEYDGFLDYSVFLARHHYHRIKYLPTGPLSNDHKILENRASPLFHHGQPRTALNNNDLPGDHAGPHQHGRPPPPSHHDICDTRGVSVRRYQAEWRARCALKLLDSLCIDIHSG